MLAILLLCIASASARQLPRIVNGDDAAKGDHGHQISLLFKPFLSNSFSHSCGGSILSKDWVITAGHCVNTNIVTSASNYRVVVNEHDRSQSTGTTYNVESIHRHPEYDQGQGFTPNDIALLKLSSAISEDFTSIKPQTESDVDGNNCTITGWGRISGSGSLANVLQETTGTLLKDTECSGYWGSSYNPENMICIHNDETGACNGDSGGPMACEHNGTPVLSGVTSWGAAGCNVTQPSVYTRVSNFVGWIKNTTELTFD